MANRPRTSPERGRLRRHRVRLVDEELNALAAAKYLLDVLDHDIFDVVELCLGARNLVDGRVGVVRMHEGCNCGREGALKAVCRCRARHGRGGGELGELGAQVSGVAHESEGGRALRCKSIRNANGVLLCSVVVRWTYVLVAGLTVQLPRLP